MSGIGMVNHVANDRKHLGYFSVMRANPPFKVK